VVSDIDDYTTSCSGQVSAMFTPKPQVSAAPNRLNPIYHIQSF
jgi:hypothetical protein